MTKDYIKFQGMRELPSRMTSERLDYLRAAADEVHHAGIVAECVAEIDTMRTRAEAAEDVRDALKAQLRETLDALVLVLPLARGYAHEHPVGANQQYVSHATDVLAGVYQ